MEKLKALSLVSATLEIEYATQLKVDHLDAVKVDVHGLRKLSELNRSRIGSRIMSKHRIEEGCGLRRVGTQCYHR